MSLIHLVLLNICSHLCVIDSQLQSINALQIQFYLLHFIDRGQEIPLCIQIWVQPNILKLILLFSCLCVFFVNYMSCFHCFSYVFIVNLENTCSKVRTYIVSNQYTNLKWISNHLSQTKPSGNFIEFFNYLIIYCKYIINKLNVKVTLQTNNSADEQL